MFKKPVLLLSLILFLGGFLLIAQAPEVKAHGQEGEAGLTPDSPWYFLDIWGEQISLLFTFNQQAKIEKALAYAQEKVAELEAMPQEAKEEAIAEAGKKYGQYLDLVKQKTEQVKNQGVDIDELSQRVAEATLKHQERLAEVYEQAPEEAKQAIENALEKSQHGHNTAVQAINSAQIKEQVQEKVRQMQDQLGQSLSEEQKEQIEQVKSQVRTLAENGISQEEWEGLKEDLIGLIEILEQVIQDGVPQEDKEKALEALDQLEEAALNSDKMTDQQKQDALDLIAQIENLVETGLTPAQKTMLISALEELKNIINDLPAPNQEQIKEKIQQGMNQEQQDALEETKQEIQQKFDNLKSQFGR